MRCSRCLYPDTKPDLSFDENGVCSACQAYEKRKQTDWDERAGRLADVLEGARNGSGYDCIVPSSGGKDSHYQVLTLIEMGARPLVVTATTCDLTPMGRKNIDNLSRYATTIEVTADRRVRKKLNKLGLTLVGDISWPEHAVIWSVPLKIAKQTGIPLVFYGECPQNQYGGPPGSDEAYEMTQRWVSEFGGFNGLRPLDFVGQEGITMQEMMDYMMPEDTTGITAYFLGQFLPWDSRANARKAIAHGMAKRLPYSGSWWDFENLDNFQTGLHDYLMYLKFGYGRAAAQLSVDIRSGHISRDEAVPFEDGRFPKFYMGKSAEDILADIDVTMEEFHDICEQFRCLPSV